MLDELDTSGRLLLQLRHLKAIRPLTHHTCPCPPGIQTGYHKDRQDIPLGHSTHSTENSRPNWQRNEMGQADARRSSLMP